MGKDWHLFWMYVIARQISGEELIRNALVPGPCQDREEKGRNKKDISHVKDHNLSGRLVAECLVAQYRLRADFHGGLQENKLAFEEFEIFGYETPKKKDFFQSDWLFWRFVCAGRKNWFLVWYAVEREERRRHKAVTKFASWWTSISRGAALDAEVRRRRKKALRTTESRDRSFLWNGGTRARKITRCVAVWWFVHSAQRNQDDMLYVTAVTQTALPLTRHRPLVFLFIWAIVPLKITKWLNPPFGFLSVKYWPLSTMIPSWFVPSVPHRFVRLFSCVFEYKSQNTVMRFHNMSGILNNKNLSTTIEN